MDRLTKISNALAIILDVVMASFFAAILLITILQVLLRYGFNASVLGGGEAMEGLFIYTSALGAAAAVRRREHIRINFLVKLLPVVCRRIVDVLVHLLVAFLNGAMIYYSLAWIAKVGGNESPVMRIPEWTVQISIPLGCGLVIFYCLFNITLTVTGRWPETTEQAC